MTSIPQAIESARSAGWVTLQGDPFPGQSGGPQQVNVLLGDTPPQITDGYAQWQSIGRPLSRGVTVFQGFNPATMLLDGVRLGRWYESGWQTDDLAGIAVEDDIEWLGWMAGEAYATGASPVIYLGTAGSHLIPQRWQGANHPWVISALAWGGAWRNQSGRRVYQEASITLMQYINYTAIPKYVKNQAGGTFVATATRNTPLLIAQAPSTRTPARYIEMLAWLIVNASQNKALRLRSPRTPIKPGKHVFVPSHAQI